MITLKQESVLLKKIKSLTELEFASLMEQVVEHAQKNRWNHVIDSIFDTDDYQSTISGLEDDLEQAEDDLSSAESAKQRALNILENIEELDDDIQKEIDKAIQELS